MFALVETNGNVRSQPVSRVDAKTLRAAMEECIDPSASIVTDEFAAYPKAAAGFAGGHKTVSHSSGQYVNADGSLNTSVTDPYQNFMSITGMNAAWIGRQFRFGLRVAF